MKKLALALLLVSMPALAEEPDRFSASVDGGAEYTSNPFLLPADAKPEGDTVLTVHPSFDARMERRGFLLSASYDVRYWHYTGNTELSRALHDLRARASLLYWENVELEAHANLTPTPLTFGGPLDDPTNNAQSARLGAKLGYRRELGRSTRVAAGYAGESVTWLEVHKDDPKLPAYVLHDPGLSIERDVGRRYMVGLAYRFRLQDFEEDAMLSGDVTAHAGILRVSATPTEWLTLALAGGAQQATFENEAFDSSLHRLIDISARAGGEILLATVSYSEKLASDPTVSGEVAEVRLARAGVDYEPFAPWAVGLGLAYGQQEFIAGTTFGAIPRSFTMAELTLAYRVRSGIVELGGSFYSSPEDPKIEVMRAGLRLGGRF